MKSVIRRLREEFHKAAFADLIRIDAGTVNFADTSSRLSKLFASGIIENIGYKILSGKKSGQSAGREFEGLVRKFIESYFLKLYHLRPGRWGFAEGRSIAEFEQYAHLVDLQAATDANPKLAAIIGGDYIIKPDIVVFRDPELDGDINKTEDLVDDQVARLTALRQANGSRKILHASISCKWTIRSDRSQNSRTEALNLIRNRKGNLPHIMVVTAEPLPSRLASIALGTGDVDCVYHFALPELQKAVNSSDQEDTIELLKTMIEGRRLRDISDLPLDMAV